MKAPMMDNDTGGDNEYPFLNESVMEIAHHFNVPPTTAVSWERLGDLESLKQTVGKNGPDDYLHLIRRREWSLDERTEIENEWLKPIRGWYYEKADSISLIKAFAKNPELEEDFNRHREKVKYELARLNDDWRALTIEIRKIENRLLEIYQSHLLQAEEDFQYKKDKIIELKEVFPYLRVNEELVAKATDSSLSYVKKFKEISGEGITNREVNSSLRNEVLARDDHSCVSCDQKDELTVHHIIPRTQGGANTKANLAVLCWDCHYYAHGGGKARNSGGYTIADWETVEYSGQEEFWNEWIHQDFEERAPKGFTRLDFTPDN